jgi:PAS domain S-box-containing protein
MAERLAAFDWAASPLGARAGWPASLVTLVDLIIAAQEPMCIAWGPDSIFLYNDAHAPLLGAYHPGAFGQPYFETFAALRGEIEPLFARVFAGEAISSPDLAVTVDRGSGQELAHFELSYTPIRAASGEVQGLFCTSTEVTGRILAERAATKERDRLRDQMLQIPGFVAALTGPEHVYEYVNEAYVALMGQRDFIGRSVRDVLPEAEGQDYLELLDQVYATGERYDAKAMAMRVSGEPADRYVDFAYTPIRNTANEVTGIFVAGYDSTERERAAQALRRLNETLEQQVAARTSELRLLEKIFDDTDVLVMAVDLDHRILAINRANADEFELTTGVRPKVGDNLLELITDPEYRASAQEAWARGLAGEEVTYIDSFGPRTHGRRSYEISFRSLRDETGMRVGAYQMTRDITDQVRDQARLAQAQEALIQSRKLEAMGQLTGGVAHDFNNLLTPIVGSLDLLIRRKIGGEREQRLIEGAFQSAERAAVLVQRLLAFGRRQPLQARPVDIGSLVQGIGDLIVTAVGPQVSVSLDIDPDAPAAHADANQLEMAILNLAINARDAMEGGGALKIGVSWETVPGGHSANLTPGDYVRIEVADTGSGMDEATLARAIEPFYSTKGIGKGTGLGLSMAHGLASQLGGALTIASTPKVGTEVTFWLPVSHGVVEPARRAPATASPTGGGQTVLLVDDEDYVRAATADMLSELAFDVHEAASAEAALAVLESGLRPDVLVTDHMMPGMSGVELAYNVRARFPSTRILIISGFAEVDGLDPTLPRLAKPFLHRDLAAAVADLRDG